MIINVFADLFPSNPLQTNLLVVRSVQVAEVLDLGWCWSYVAEFG